jgi:hypothetical protein
MKIDVEISRKRKKMAVFPFARREWFIEVLEMTNVSLYAKDMKKTDSNKKKAASSTAAGTREKLAGLPFEKAADLKKAQDELRFQMWKRLENARLFNELSQKDEYQFIKEEFKHGLSCNYGDETDYLVKVFSEGLGVKIDINKDLVKNIPNSKAFVETLIRSMGDTFSKSYYQAKGILAPDAVSIEDLVRELQKKPTGNA